MQRPFKPMAAGFCLVCLALFASPTLAQEKKEKKYKEIDFTTVDQVTLSGRYWPSKLGAEAPVALLLHKIGGKSTEDGWTELAEELNKADFAVLTFDFRGHGDSQRVSDMFSKYPLNRLVRVKKDDGGKLKIDQADFSATYVPHLVNDIAAAKQFLVDRHNARECNTSALVLIGAEDGATLGSLWLATEMKRHLHPVDSFKQIGARNTVPESKDVIACVWLNLAAKIGTQSINLNSLKSWLRDAGNTKESKVPTIFVYGNEDKTSGTNALAYVKAIRPKYVPDSKVKLNDDLDGLTGRLEIRGTKLAGAKLLVTSAARDSIKEYLTGNILSQKDIKRTLNTWERRDTDKMVSGWYMTGLPYFSHRPNLSPVLDQQKPVNPVPLHLPPFNFR